ncbi:hypothetical protein O4J55_27820, partial [Paracoccus sp. PXZ]
DRAVLPAEAEPRADVPAAPPEALPLTGADALSETAPEAPPATAADVPGAAVPEPPAASESPETSASGQEDGPARPAAGSGFDLSTPPDFGALRLTD